MCCTVVILTTVDKGVKMAFITISGFPCSGKSRRAEQLRAHLERRLEDPSYEGPQLKVVVVSDDTLNIPRSVYDGEHAFRTSSATEKITGLQMVEQKNLHGVHCSPQCRGRWARILS